MKLYAVTRDGKFEKFSDDKITGFPILEEYKKTGDLALRIIAEQILNVFNDEAIAKICANGMQQDYPTEKFGVVELHIVTSSVEWS